VAIAEVDIRAVPGRPVLRLVGAVGAGRGEDAPLAVVEVVRDVSERRRERRARRSRRNRFAALIVACVAVLLLALPVAALGGRPVGGTGAVVPGGGFTYVVQPGDTLSKIAQHFEPGRDPRPLATELEQEIGSAVVVPGERIHVP
jgi:hypothetical protein